MFWWMNGKRLPNGEWERPPDPYGAVFHNQAAAEAAASVRNAMVIHVRAKGVIEVEGADWFRRDDAGKPLSVEWREIGGQARPWTPQIASK